MKNNDLRGLDLNGFSNPTTEFNPSIFNDREKIDLIRIMIRMNFTKTKGFYRFATSYGLKHHIERRFGDYVSNGELIYAMHLEGFKIKRLNINGLFNLSATSLKQFLKIGIK
ncbi:hypothetical protein JBL43_08030 [Aureibaculum sp. A20]|uniref:Uncharacterized protein n=1 Tax=Aureibaculum flavum TaxID=2795986 RepID=A0ABS0WQC4_9FLAO|nr:hypothetical protein [Aureibaculum flavum]MBJ2174182.1 hypothetical protein [Aureibaculum flavum]